MEHNILNLPGAHQCCCLEEKILKRKIFCVLRGCLTISFLQSFPIFRLSTESCGNFSFAAAWVQLLSASISLPLSLLPQLTPDPIVLYHHTLSIHCIIIRWENHRRRFCVCKENSIFVLKRKTQKDKHGEKVKSLMSKFAKRNNKTRRWSSLWSYRLQGKSFAVGEFSGS